MTNEEIMKEIEEMKQQIEKLIEVVNEFLEEN